MLSLHEITKTRLCRAAFLALVVVPTLIVVVWCFVVRTSAYRAAHEQAIAAQLGLRVRMSRASSPRPGMMLYEGLELADPRNGQALARLPFAEVTASGNAVIVRLPYPAMLNGERLDTIWQLAHDLVGQQAAAGRIRFEARNLTLHFEDGDQTFTDLGLALQNDAREGRLQFTFRPAAAGDKPAPQAELRITRNRDETAPQSVCHLVTGGPLACNLVSRIWPAAAQLGKSSTFYGRVIATGNGDSWQTELSGNLDRIDLDTLMGTYRHKLTGLAQARLDRAVVVDGRLETAVGRLEAGPGTVSGSLLFSGQTHLGLNVVPELLASREPIVAYRQLGLAFQISGAGLALRGTWPERPGAILLDARQRVLVREPNVPMQDVVNLARALVPNSDVQVPATRETSDLIRALPVPSIARPAEPLPKARVLNIKRR